MDGERPSRTEILRDVLVFQVKLWLEGLKDVALVPLSIGAAVLDILFRNTTGQGTLYALMRAGDRFERWVNLYGALERKPEEESIVPFSFLDTEQAGESPELEEVQDERIPPQNQDPPEA